MSPSAGTLPPNGTLPSQSPAVIASVLDTLFEPSAQLQALALPRIQRLSADRLQSYIDLVDHIQALITDEWLGPLRRREEASEKLDEFLAAHPRLGEKSDAKSEMSRREQQAMNKGGEMVSEEEHRRKEELDVELRRMNRVYEERFPGLKFVTFVNGRSRDVIIQEMHMRIERGDPVKERDEAVQAICNIARDRAKKF